MAGHGTNEDRVSQVAKGRPLTLVRSSILDWMVEHVFDYNRIPEPVTVRSDSSHSRRNGKVRNIIQCVDREGIRLDLTWSHYHLQKKDTFTGSGSGIRQDLKIPIPLKELPTSLQLLLVWNQQGILNGQEALDRTSILQILLIPFRDWEIARLGG